MIREKSRAETSGLGACRPGAPASSVGGDVLTYARTSGVFAGLSLGGADFTADDSANQRLYGKAVSASDIVRGSSVQPTTAGQAFASLLDSKVGAHSM